jgi:hypothetical protein
MIAHGRLKTPFELVSVIWRSRMTFSHNLGRERSFKDR